MKAVRSKKPDAKVSAPIKKVKVVEPEKYNEDSDDDSDEEMDDVDSDEESDSDKDDDEETPLKKADIGKKKPNESA